VNFQYIWIPGTHILLINNNFTKKLCDVDDWIFVSLSLCLSPFSVYYLCRFVTVCTVKKMWVRSYVMVIFVVGEELRHCYILHLVHPKTLILDRLEHTKWWPKNLANTFADALAIFIFCCFFVGDKFHWQTSQPWLDKWLDKVTCHPRLWPLLKSLDAL